ncbi:hypothetical protein ACFL35_21225 [Candidatus Riflebacteria bacterium]
MTLQTAENERLRSLFVLKPLKMPFIHRFYTNAGSFHEPGGLNCEKCPDCRLPVTRTSLIYADFSQKTRLDDPK